ncbi:MAG TPA: hypothetical protein VN887_04840 [Candidatus Angelobacter sp.]|nr:hypothetical protein [Candidatus Angelobacter sp.]
MSEYFVVTICFVILGCYVFAVFRWWHRHLTALASRYDLAERRKRASRQSLIVMLLVYLPVLAVLLVSMIRSSASGFFIVSIFILALAPTFIWYVRQIPKLRDLGYYGGQT